MPNRARKNVMRGPQKRSNIQLAIEAIRTLLKGGGPVLPPKKRGR